MRIVISSLDGDDALSGGGYADFGGNRGRDAIRASEPPQPGRGEDERVVLARIELAEPCAQVSAHGLEGRARKTPGQLCDAPDAARADARSMRERTLNLRNRQRPGVGQDEGVERILTRQHGADVQ